MMGDLYDNSVWRMSADMLEILRTHFSSADYIENSLLTALIWTSDKAATPILIEMGSRYDPRLTQHKPGLYVSGLNPQTGNIDPLRDFSIKIDSVEQTSTSYLDLVAGGHLVFCEGLTAGQTEALREEVFNLLTMFAPRIKDEYNLNTFDVKQGMELKEISREWFGAGVACSWSRILAHTLDTDG